MHFPSTSSRRSFISSMANALAGAAMTQLFLQDKLVQAGTSAFDLSAKVPNHAPRATACIHLFMNGGPSQMDLFDPKPAIQKYAGQPFPGHVESLGNQETTHIGSVMPTPFEFARYGESGLWMSEVLPHTAAVIDELCFINSLWTDHPNHDNALYRIQSGRLFMGHPSIGSWVGYGLGSESSDLPAYVVLDDPAGLPQNGVRNWTSGYLPPLYQGTRFRTAGAPVLNLTPEYEQPDTASSAARELLQRLDDRHRANRPGHAELDARIESYALAARMQLTASSILDISQESKATLEAYGIGNKATDSYGRRCLLARRMIERGVRFVQLFLDKSPWDNHSNLEKELREVCLKTDQPTAALISDLKQRGLLDSTLVVWGGEFGRTPTSQKVGDTFSGRDHNMQGFTTWLAGGGVRPGTVYGTTDDFGHLAVDNPVSVPEFHATLLWALGLDHQRLTVDRNGLQERLTGIKEVHPVTALFA